MGTPLKVFITLALVSVSGLVGLTPQPALAVCPHEVPTGAPLSGTPWPQRIWDLDKLPDDATGEGIKVAVLDSGVDSSHPQLQDKVTSIDKLPGGGVPGNEDCIGHGTAVAGLIAATQKDGITFRGLAPKAQILSARVSENVGGNENARQALPPAVADAVNWAVAQGAKVINISFAYKDPRDLEPLREAISAAVKAGVVVVAAVGNSKDDGNPTPYPAAWPDVVGVAAVGEGGEQGLQKLPQSQVGTYVDISAPGAGVTIPRPIRGYATGDGTSFAAPLVAATAALIFDRFSEQQITREEVVKRLLATADPAPGGSQSKSYGVGVVNPLRALTAVLDNRKPQLAGALPAPTVDAATIAAARRAEERKEQALWLGGIGAVAGVLALALMLALPAGTRRRWRPADR